MHQLSVVIITFNEAKNIAKCLQAAVQVADEIIVYDSFSTDDTSEIAKQFGAKVFQGAWQGYSASKNLANSQAKFDWILSLDADEVLSKTLQDDIVRLKQNGLQTASFKRLTNYCGSWIRHCGWYPDIKLRLFNRKQMQWQGLIHEQLISMTNKKISSVLLQGDCLHYSYYSVTEHYIQTEKFSGLSAQSLFEKGIKTNLISIYLAPIFKFVKMYFVQLGFLDGYYGFVVCKVSSKAIYLRNKKLKALHSNS
ncbi:MAG TPA: glycosyltransferase family 2 protein [Bacteroidia bacterium]|nr:glycosyltransferase family 2 protein [Bacteroidia bacterium]